MAPITKATIAGVSFTRDLLIPSSIWAAGGATNLLTGVDPVRGVAGAVLGNPIDLAQTLLLTNPLQHIKDGRFKVSRIGALGYKTLVSGIGPGGWRRNLTVGNLVLSTIQGGARAASAVFDMPNSTVMAAMRNARTVGIAGLLQPGSVVFDVEKSLTLQALKDGTIPDELRKTLGGKLASSHGLRASLRHLAGGGIVEADSLEKVLKHATIESTEEKTRLLLPRISTELENKGFYVGKYVKGALGHNVATWAGRTALRMGSLWTWGQIAATVGGWAVGAAVRGVSTAAINTLEVLRSVTSRDLTPSQVQSIFMTSESATERQRAVQAIYGARINPSNRFLGNEAQMYHA